tara:strand:- start:429 stop:1268 length:840 start_codon:yes stop_codon:yes gene_type:complete
MESRIVSNVRKLFYKMMCLAPLRALFALPIAFGSMLKKERNRYFMDGHREKELEVFNTILKKDLIVRSGPFKGLQYVDFVSFTSTILPKLLGTYESEIYQDLELLINNNNYDEILNIGSADGYYAIGLAQRCPDAVVYCFDVNPLSLKFVRGMATLNNAKNVAIKGLFTDEHFQDYLKGKSLVVCDVDGYEDELFNKKVLPLLKNSDIIIETHDYVVENTTQMLVDRLAETHDVKVVPYKQNKLDELPDIFNNQAMVLRKVACSERIVDNKWIVATPKE